MLSEAEYRTYISGYPQEVVYTVQNDETGDSFDFAGYANGRLLFTFASLGADLLPGTGIKDDRQSYYLGLAAHQRGVAGQTPIQWLCQRGEDADALRSLLEANETVVQSVAGGGSIEVRALRPDPTRSPDQVER